MFCIEMNVVRRDDPAYPLDREAPEQEIVLRRAARVPKRVSARWSRIGRH